CVEWCCVCVYVVTVDGVLFFFSSRRRHTRLVSDWSSDVCSSDLVNGVGDGGHGRHDGHLTHPAHAKRVGGIGHLDDHRIDHRERSEERRVGKEGRCGGAASHEKKKKEERREELV